MVICTNCKKELPDDALFCDSCGAKVEQKPIKAEEEKQEAVWEEQKTISDKEAVQREERMVSDEKSAQETTFIFCPACGSKISIEYEFCPKCGNNIMQQIGVGVKQEGKEPKTRGKGKKIASILLVLAVLLGIGVGSVCLIRIMGKDYTNRLLYVKKNKMFMTGEKGEDVVTLSKKIDEDGEDIVTELENDLCDYITVYKDDKRIVYPDKMSYVKDNGEDEYEDDEDSYDDGEEDDENSYDVLEYSLYYRSLKDSDMEPVKIDSGIQNRYQVTEDGNRIFYQKGSALYVYDFEKKEKIASDVKEYEMNNDGSRVVYLCEAGLYYKENGKDKQKLSDSVRNDEDAFYVTGDFSKVYYVTEDLELYQRAVDGRESKIADKISSMSDVQVYDSGELYYKVSEELQLKVADYITDDMSPSEPLTEPECPKEPEYPDWDDYEDEAAYDKAYKKYEKKYKKWETAYEEYEEAYNAYEAAAEESETIAAVMQATFSVPKLTYYYYDGKTSKELGHITGDLPPETEETVWKKSEMVFCATKDENLPNLKLSEVWQRGLESEDVYEMDEEEMPAFAVSELENAFMEMVDESSEVYLAVGGSTYNLGSIEDFSDWNMNGDGTFIVYLEDDNLMQIMIKDGKPQKAVTYDTDVTYYTSAYSSENKDILLYFKNFDDGLSGELYKNKVKIDEDVLYYSCDYYEEEDSLYYYKDYDNESGTGTLMVYKDGKTKELAVDVHDYNYSLENKKLYYVTDWDDENKSGSIYFVEGDKPVRMADDVYLFYVLGDGSFYYLTNYNSDKGVADLYLYQNKEDKMIASDVQKVLVPWIELSQTKEEE